MGSASFTDGPRARFWHRISAPSGADECGAFAAVRGISATESAIVLTDSPSGAGRAHLVGGLACSIIARMAAGASPAGALTVAARSVATVSQGSQPLLVVAFAAVLDHANERLTYAAAGHEVALIVRSAGACKMLPSTGPALGSIAQPRFNVRSISIHPGDTLVVTTENDAALLSEIERAARAALDHAKDPAVAVVDAVGRFAVGGAPRGHATIVSTFRAQAA